MKLEALLLTLKIERIRLHYSNNPRALWVPAYTRIPARLIPALTEHARVISGLLMLADVRLCPCPQEHEPTWSLSGLAPGLWCCNSCDADNLHQKDPRDTFLLLATRLRRCA